jgi:exosortase/archaeosortase family protein
MKHPLAILAITIAATWDAWVWYCRRVAAAPEEAAALALLVGLPAALAIPRLARRRPDIDVPLLPMALLLAAYAAGQSFVPPIIRSAIAVAAVLLPLYVAAFRERPPAAFWGLAMLAMPVLPSLQFTLGYPMRVISASLTSALLAMQGLDVSRQGTFLVWRGEIVQFDAPCSGVNMLWAGLLLTLVACLLFRLCVVRVAAAVMLSVAITLAANVLRAASLFYVEAGLIEQAPPWWHEGVGVVAFAMSAAVTLWMVLGLSDQGRIRWLG